MSKYKIDIIFDTHDLSYGRKKVGCLGRRRSTWSYRGVGVIVMGADVTGADVTGAPVAVDVNAKHD